MFIMNKGLKRSLAFWTTVVFIWQQTGFSDQIVTDGKTDTHLDINGSVTDVFTNSIEGANAYNSFSKFDVYANNVVNLYLPSGTENLLNFVHDQATRIDGILNSIKNGQLGGNVYLLNPNGISVGSNGVVNVGSLTMTTPQKSFMDAALSAGLVTAPAAEAVLKGTLPINKDASILVEGKINAIDDVKLNAGRVNVSGKIASDAIYTGTLPDFSDVVNANDISHGVQLLVSDGEIEIIANESIEVTGDIISRNGGKINFLAPEIKILSGAQILADADAGQTAGTINFYSKQFALVGVNREAKTLIEINNSILKAKDISLKTFADTSMLAALINEGVTPTLEDAQQIVDNEITDTVTGLFLNLNTDASAIINIFNNSQLLAEGKIDLESLAGARNGYNKKAVAKINVVDSIVKANTVDMNASADTSLILDIADHVDIPGLESVNDELFDYTNDGIIANSDSVAEVVIEGNSLVEVEQDLVMNSFSRSRTNQMQGGMLVGFAKADSKAIAKTAIDGNAIVTVKGDLNMDAETQNGVDAIASSHAMNKPLAVTVVLADAETDTKTYIGENATVDVDQDINMNAVAGHEYVVSAAAIEKGGSSIGAALALSYIDSDTQAYIAGDVFAKGDIALEAVNDTEEVLDSVGMSNGSTSGYTAKFTNYKAKLGQNITNAILGKHSKGAKLINHFFFKGIKSGKLNMSGSVSYTDSKKSTKAYIADNANVESLSDIRLKASSVDDININAFSKAKSDKVALGGAVALGNYTNNVSAYVGKNATVKSTGTLKLEADNRVPAPWEIDFSSNEDILEHMGQSWNNWFFTSFTKSSSKGSKLGLAGSFSLLDYNNSARAYIDSGADVTANKLDMDAYNEQTVVTLVGGMTAKSSMQDRILKGIIDSDWSNGDSGNAMGGSVTIVSTDNDTAVYIADGATVNVEGDIEMDAKSDEQYISVAMTKMAGKEIGVVGSVALPDINSKTLAFIDDNANVSSNSNISLKADGTTDLLAITGGVTGGKSVGVGASVSYANVDTKVKAFIGDGAKELDDIVTDTHSAAGSVYSKGNTSVVADAKSEIGSYSLAGTKMSQTEIDAGTSDPGAQSSKGGKFGIGVSGDVSLNEINSASEAYIDGNVLVTSEADLKVEARNDADLTAIAGSVTIASKDTSVGIAGSYAQNTINNTTSAKISSANVNADKIEILANNISHIISITASGTANGKVGIAGNVSYNTVLNNTYAGVLAGASVKTLNDLMIKAKDNAIITAVAGALTYGGKDSKAGIGASVVLNDLEQNTTASSEDSDLDSDGNITVEADSESDLVSVAAAVAAGKQDMAATAVVVVTDTENTTQAFIKGSKTAAGTVADDDITVKAKDQFNMTGVAGDVTMTGGQVGIGASNLTTITNNTVDAHIADNTKVTAKNLSVTADSTEDIDIIAAGVVAAKTAGISASAPVNLLTETTRAYIGKNADIDTTENISVDASDTTKLVSVAGALGVGKSAGIGAGADVAVINKDTQAYVDSSAGLEAGKNIFVKAFSKEDMVSVAAAAGLSTSVGLAGAATVYVVNLVTKAFINNNASVNAQGSIVVNAKDDNEIDIIDGTAAFGSMGAGLSASTYIVDKTTQAYVANSASVNAYAKDSIAAVEVDTGKINISYVDNVDDENEVKLDQEITDDRVDNQATTKQRVATADKTNIKGLSITAISKDDIETVAAAGAGGSSAGVAGSGAVTLVTNDTTAYVGENVQINQNKAAAGNSQSVHVGAATDLYRMGVAAAVAIGGSFGAGPGADVAIVENNTKAYIGKSADVYAKKDILVSADSKQDMLSVAAALAGSGTAAVAGAVSYNLIDNETEAYIDEGAVLDAESNIKVAANDDTNIDVIDGGASIGIGGAGVGGAVSVTNINKNTKAYTNKDVVIDAKANTSNSLGTKQGLEILANSKEDLLTIAACGAAGLYAGVAGAVSVNNVSSNTSAYLGQSNKVNQAAGANVSQAVNINAFNELDLLSVGGALGGGAVGVSGGVDIGIIKNDTSAYIFKDSKVAAKSAVNIDAKSDKDIDTYAAAVSGGLVGVAGGVSVYSIGTNLSADAKDSLKSDGGDHADAQSYADQQAQGAGAVSVLQNYDDQRIKDAGTRVSNAQANSGVASAVNSTAVPAGTNAFTGDNVTINAGTDLNISATDKVDFTSGAGSASGGGVAIGGAVTIVNVDSKVNAFAGTSNTLSANNNITVDSNSDLDASLTAITGGAGGLVSLGAAVAVVNANVDNNAFIADGATIDDANKVEINADSDADIDVDALGANVGSVAAGVVVAETNLDSNTNSELMSSTRIGQSSTVNELVVKATATNNVDTYTVAAAGGILSGNGSVATSNNTTNVDAKIGSNNLIKTDNKVEVDADADGYTKAKATGVGLGLLNVGVSIAKANATPTVNASVADSNIIRSSDLIVDANLDEEAVSFASGSSGALIGISATESEAKTVTNVKSKLGTSNSVYLGNNLNIKANNLSKQKAYVDGNVVGIVAAGSNKSEAISNSTTNATLGSAADISVQTLYVNAQSADETYAEAEAGSGGIVAGSAAEAKTNATSNTKARIDNGSAGKTIIANTVDLDASHTQKIDSAADSLGAGVVGASGAITNNRTSSTVAALMGDNLDVKAESLLIDAVNKVHKNIVSGTNNKASSGGLLGGAAGSSYTEIKNYSSIDLGTNTKVDLIADTLGNDDDIRIPGSLKLNILNEVIADDKSRLDAGGAISVALAESKINNSANNATITIGAGTELKNDSDIDLAIRNNTNIKTDANVKTYGAAGAAQGKTESISMVNNTININAASKIITKSNTVDPSDGNLRLMIGQDSSGNVSNHTVKATTDLYNKTALPIETKPDADAKLYQSHNINIAGGSSIETNGNVSLKANKGNRDVKGYGEGTDLYREIIGAVSEFFGGSSLEIKSGRSIDSASTTVTVDGKVEVGTENVKKIVINKDGTLDSSQTTEGLSITTSSENVENNIQDRIDEIGQMISALEEKVNTGSTPSGYSNTALYSEKQNLQSERSGVTTSIANIDEEIRQTNLDSDAKRTEISNNETTISNNNTQIAANNTQIAALDAEYPDASEDRKKQINNEKATLNSDNTTRTNENTSLTNSNTTLQGQIDDNDTSVGNQQTERQTYVTRIGEIDTRISEIDSQLVVDNSGDSDLQQILAKYKAEKAMLEAQLAGLGGSSSNVGIIDVDQEITAKSSNIYIEADNLKGSGDLIAPGDTLVEIENKSQNFLRTNKMTIPDEAGGKIFYNDIFVKSNEEINSRNKTYSGAGFASVTTCDNTTAEVKVLNSYVPTGSERAPDIFVAKDIRNRYGKVSITSSRGSVKVNEGVDITADTIRIKAGRDVFIGYKDGFRNVAGDVYAHWRSLSDPKQSGRVDFSTWWQPENLIDTSFADDPSVLAGNNIFISGEYLNINGKIQSGIADRKVNLGTDLNAVIAQYQTDYNNGVETESRVNVNALAGSDPSQIAVIYDADKQRLEVEDVDILGGYVELYGHIMNTAEGEINVLDGYGTIDITNNTNYDLEVKGLNTGEGIEGTIKITDTGKSSAASSSTPLVTVIKRLNGTVYEFNNDATGTLEMDQLNIADAVDSLAGRAFEYKPLENQYYTWTQRDIETWTEKRKYVREKWFGFTTDTEYSYSGWERGPSSYGTPIGSAVLRQVDLGGATYSYDNTSYLQTTHNWHNTSGWHNDKDYVAYRKDHKHQEKDMKLTNYHTHNVKAFNPIDINFIGSDTGRIDVVSDKGNILINGAVKNVMGVTDIDATSGSILQGINSYTDSKGTLHETNPYAEITSQYLNLNAGQGIGTSPNGHLKVNLVNGGDLTATSMGDINIKLTKGDLVYKHISTMADVSIKADTDIRGYDSSSLISANLIEIESEHGAVGANGAAVRVNSAASSNGGLSVKAASDIYVDETTGDLYLVAAESSGGNATIRSLNGSIVDNNKVETEDSRTKAQLLTLWSDMQLTGDDAKASAQSTVDAYERLREYEYNKYWRYRDSQADSATYDANHQITLSQEEVDHYKNNYGWTDTEISDYETKMTNEYHDLHNTYGAEGDTYNDSWDYNVVEGSAKWDELTVGSSWTEEELANSINVGLVKETSDTEIRIEDSNVSAHNVTLYSSDAIGHDKAQVTIYAADLETDKLWSDLDENIPEEKAILDKIYLLMSAEKKDIIAETAEYITIQTREDIDVTATGDLNVTVAGAGNIYLGSEDDLNIASVATTGDARIKTAGAIVNKASNGPAVSANKLILEAGRGYLGSQAKEMIVETNELTARSGNDLYIKEHTGNMNISTIYATGKANLRTDASIVDAHNTGDVNVRAESLHVDVAGDMGTVDNFVEVGLDRSGEFTAQMPNGDIYISSPNRAFTTGDVNLGTGNLNVIANEDIVINSENGGIKAHYGTVYLDSAKSILDGDDNTDAGIEAQFIDLVAADGDIGQKDNVLEIDTMALVAGSDSFATLGSDHSIYVEETIGDVLIKDVKSADGDVELEAKDGILTVENAEAFNNVQLKALTDVEITKATANGNVKVVAANGSINGTAGVGANISGTTIELKAENGSVGSIANALDLDCKVDASAAGDIVLNEVAGDMEIGLIESTAGDVVLTANNGSIIDAEADDITDIKANNIAINVSGNIGHTDNALEIEARNAGLINAQAGANVNLAEEGDMNVGLIESLIGDVKLKANAILDGLNTLVANVKAKDLSIESTATDIGAQDNYLDIDVSSKTKAVAQRSIYLREVNGDMDIESVSTKTGNINLENVVGDINLEQADSAADLNLKSVNDINVGFVKAISGKVTAWAKENISDMFNNDNSNIDAVDIALTADSGFVGSKDNFLDIDSSNAFEGKVDATAEKGIYLRETDGELNIGTFEVRNGDLALDVSGDIKLGVLNAKKGDIYAKTQGSILDAGNTDKSNINSINAELIAVNGSIGEKSNLLDTNIDKRVDLKANKDIAVNELDGGLALGKVITNKDFVIRSNGDVTNSLAKDQVNIEAKNLDVLTHNGDFGKSSKRIFIDTDGKANIESARGIYVQEAFGDLNSDYLYARGGELEVKVEDGNINVLDVFSWGDAKIMIPETAFDNTRKVSFDFSWQHDFVQKRRVRMARLNKIFTMPKKAFVFEMRPLDFGLNMYPLASADIAAELSPELENVAEAVKTVETVAEPKVESKVEPKVKTIIKEIVETVKETVAKPQAGKEQTPKVQIAPKLDISVQQKQNVLPQMQTPSFKPAMSRPVLLFYHELGDEENASTLDKGVYEYLEEK